MSVNPTRKLKRRLGAAIDWRVRDAIEPALDRSTALLEEARQAERANDQQRLDAALEGLGASLAHISTTLTEQQRSLGELLEQLDRRVTELEQR